MSSVIKSKKEAFLKFILSSYGTFTLGAIIGFLVFLSLFGLDVVNIFFTDWIWNRSFHDTAQHFIGWQFFANDSSGAIINGLAYPHGLPITFMDSIPLLAFIFKAMGFGSDIQYFGIWSLICFILMGGLSALIARWLWLKLWPRSKTKLDNFTQVAFIASVALIFSMSPMVIARTMYHSALAGQWLILLAFLLIIKSSKYQKWWQFSLVWSSVLIGALLIHPYFLPMLGAMMLVALIKAFQTNKFWPNGLCKIIASIALPIISAGIAFYLIGGFSLGSGAEIYDLEEKGFNLLSFFNPLGYSKIPSFSNRSSSPETMMWLGVGILIIAIANLALLFSNGGRLLSKLRSLVVDKKIKFSLVLVVLLLLLIFAVGPRVDLGPISLFSYAVPNKIYELWTAFRAAAREAWPFYYAFIFAVIALFVWLVKKRFRLSMAIKIIIVALPLAGVIQFYDIYHSSAVTEKRLITLKAVQSSHNFKPLNLNTIYKKQRHLIALDDDFRGDQSGTYRIARTALVYNGLSLNSGFFARLPKQVKLEQADWRHRVKNCAIKSSDTDLNIFFTKNRSLANQVVNCKSGLKISNVDGFYLIYR